MQNIFVEVTSLDKRCIETFALSEEVMMEHAANTIAQLIRSRFTPHSSLLIVCGSGNNGADGLALARLLEGEYRVTVHLPLGASSPLAHLQRERIESLGMKHSSVEGDYDIIVDALFGSGLNRPLGPSAVEIIEQMNSMSGAKIACDVPSGLYPDGTFGNSVFDADITVTMGGLKRSLFSDSAKEITGEILVANLGVPRHFYETESSWKLLETTDLNLPHRTHASTHKGSYGHLSVVCGEKIGASVIAASAALRFGTGLVSIISNENVTIPHELMQSHSLPSGTTAIALGMGLGEEFCDDELSQLLDNTHPMILDADIFYHPIFPDLLKRPNIVLTPHPKEFTQILRLTGIADIDVNTLQNDRFGYVEQFCAVYPNTVLVLKGSNVIIGAGEVFYINPHGTVALAKGGSGDVLSGLIGALLAQGYSPLDAAIQGSLAHTIAAKHFEKNNYALTPFDLIERICIL
ncbi:NAD(P)H-hydrate dehydratase [Sulfuricurvum sp.]|uniref:NAD(P)H-hydrate dehydratase n=1 Tax=Sulfuricurvum sp. TaxID=2025608 RepID=UPI002635F633|nr:NAD(P)H-hydrate dehydratase [Sulfuricurvum sp.]MDD2265691.1 NAD(P)H-hydrate dehydratase [Sulfuricurvum sp.]MDD2784021.1 NAD(P)H-hydrate dehydratase [Sulfuricurvum sp.]